MDVVTQSLALARLRLYAAGQRFRARVGGLGDDVREVLDVPLRTASGLVYGGAARDPLPSETRQSVSAFAGQDDFSDLDRRYNFEARDARGNLGRYTVSVRELLRIEQSYHAAVAALERELGQLEAAGVITRTKPSASDFNVSRTQNTASQERAIQNEHNIFAYGDVGRLPSRIADPRLFTGDWFDWPRYAGLINDGYNQSPTAFTFDQFSPGPWLAGIPLPKQWVKYYPTPRLFDRNAFGDDAFVRSLENLTVNAVVAVRGANANPEWHPGLVMGNNGVYPWWMPNIGVFQQVEARYQYKFMHPWAKLTRGAPIAQAGFTLDGKTDFALWINSMRTRSPRAWAARHTPAGAWNNDWAELHYADAVANFVQFVNIASFIKDLGAQAHVSAACEYHAAVMAKAYDELGLPAGASVQTYINAQAQERAARDARAGVGSNGSSLTLVSGPSASADRQIANTILNGAVNMSMALFLANPYVGMVALAITGLAVFITNLFLGAAFDCRGEQLLVRDGRIAVRAVDLMECAGRSGDVYGGNYLPHRRADAIRGRPVIRVVDQYGREVSA